MGAAGKENSLWVFLPLFETGLPVCVAPGAIQRPLFAFLVAPHALQVECTAQ